MINLRNSPFLWLAFVLLAAFTLENGLDVFALPWMKYLLVSGMIISALMAFGSYTSGYKYLPTISLSLLVFLAGLMHQSEFRKSLYPAQALTTSMIMSGTVEVKQVLKAKQQSISLQCAILNLQSVDSNKMELTDKNILLLVRNPVAQDFYPGDLLQVYGWTSPIQGPLNPNAFDARIYYQTIGIRHQITVEGERINIELPYHFLVERLTAEWQSALSNIVRKHTADESAQVINALVWGDRSDMAADVRDAFADSGAMHVLSVSGMHVAMIYSMLMIFLGAPGNGTFAKRIFRFIAYSTAILLYVGLTGACPAVVRAGLMILLYLFGKTMGWNTQVWNLLGFAAFMMLWLNPFIYFNIGFQLSFLAIAGILLYAKPIIRTCSFRYKIFHWTWEIIALSLAAQVFIMAILLGQFHQFPLTFIISSIVAIPAGYIIIVGAILNVLLSFVHIEFLWPIVDYSTRYFIASMQWMAGLNPEMNYSLPSMAAWTLSLVSIFFSASLLYRWPFGKKLAYGCCCICLAVLFDHRAMEWKTDELIIYHTFKGSMLDISHQGQAYTIIQGVLTPEQEKFAARGYRCKRDFKQIQRFITIENFSTDKFVYQNSILRSGTVSIFLFNNKSALLLETENPDYVFVQQADSIEVLKNKLCANPTIKVILAAAISKKQIRKLTYFLKDNQEWYYDISQSGYFKLDL